MTADQTGREAANSRNMSSAGTTRKKNGLRDPSTTAIHSNPPPPTLAKENSDMTDDDNDATAPQQQQTHGSGKPAKVNKQGQLVKCIRLGVLASLSDYAVSQTLHEIEYFLPPEGSDGDKHGPPTPPHTLGYTFKCKAYCPQLFRDLRAAAGVSEEDYKKSVALMKDMIDVGGLKRKAGTYFLSANSSCPIPAGPDGRYMIKVHPQAESKFLRTILPDYLAYVKKDPGTLLVRHYGLYRLRVPGMDKNLHFIIMDNILKDTPARSIVYDLKGSTVGRYTITEGKGVILGTHRRDVNFRQDKVYIHMGERKGALLEQLKHDVEFLAAHRATNYSFMVAITGTPGDHNLKYSIGITNVLQAFTPFKSLRAFVAGLLHDKLELTVVEPRFFARRLRGFIESICL